MRYTFGAYTLDTQRYELYPADIPLQLQPKVCDLLAYVLQHRDRVVTRQELFDALWPGHFVSDDALEWVMAAARRAVGDSGRAQRVIKTIRNRGYRWMVPVAAPPSASSDVKVLPPPVSVPAAEPDLVVPLPGDGERKLVTVLAGALAHTEALTEGLDPETLLTVRRRFFTLAQQEVQRYEGTMQHVVDDRFLAFFGTPVAHEDHAQRAVLAALSFQECLRHSRDAVDPIPDGAGAARMALHTGEVVISHIGDAPRPITLALGDTTHMAEQLLHVAAPGVILLSDTTRRLVQGVVAFETNGPVQMRGTTPPLQSYKVLGRVPQQTDGGWRGRRAVRHFVGRERDMATLHALLAQVEEGHGQVLGLVGEPGIGKSRLLYEFRQQVRGRPLTYLAGRCLSYARATPYFPLLDIIRQACGLTDTDTLETTVAQVRLHLQEVGMEPEAWVPYMLRLLQIQEGTDSLALHSPQAIRARTFEMLVQMSLQRGLQQPLLLEVEDLHWIDPTSEEWVALLVERLAGVPLLLLLSYRPGYRPAWMDKSYATQLALQRLTVDDSRELVQAVVHPRSLVEPLLQDMITKANGNPFFLEELAQAIGEQEHRHAPSAVPETIQAVLAARLDLLPLEAKYLLQMASVIGTEVSGPLLQRVSALPDATLQQHLRHLQSMEFLFETRPLPELTYTFKHALTQEVAYQSLLRQTRQQVHHQTAQVLVEHFANTMAARPELVAHHYTEAGLYEQALPYWQRAAERAAGRSAHREAIVHCTRGLAVLATLPETLERAAHELRLQVSLGFAQQAIAGFGSPGVEHALERALELCPRVDDTPHSLMVLRGLSIIYLYQGKMREAQVQAEHYLRLSQRVGDWLNCQKAYLRLGQIAFYLGELPAARTHMQEALTLSKSQHNGSSIEMGIDMGVDVRASLAVCLWFLGYPAQARACVQEALILARARAHTLSLASAWQHAAHIEAFCGAWHAAQAHADALQTLATDQELAWFAGCALHYQGQALVAQGHTAEGIAQMHRGMVAAQGMSEIMQQYLCACLAEAYGRSGQGEAGLALLADALAHLQTRGRRIIESRLYRVQGELLLALSTGQHQAEAERCFHHALAVARQQQAKGLELAAALPLSRLWQRQGKRTAALQLLAEVYGWFTEGFDTADLQEAQALLRQLSVAP